LYGKTGFLEEVGIELDTEEKVGAKKRAQSPFGRMASVIWSLSPTQCRYAMYSSIPEDE
jgi:hypothetical protein